MKGLRFADSQESRFQASKRSIMVSAVLVNGRSADILEFCFQAAKCSDMDCAELQGCQFAYSQEFHFHAAKRSDKSSTILQGVYFLMLRNRVYSLRTLRYGHCRHELTSICL